MITLGQPSDSFPERRSPRLAMAGITKRFGATVALDSVDLKFTQVKSLRWLVRTERASRR